MFTYNLFSVLLASHCSGRKQDGRPSSPKGEKREEPPIRNDDTHQQAVHFTELMPEKIFGLHGQVWVCSSNATHAINHIIELTNNIIAMEKMFEEGLEFQTKLFFMTLVDSCQICLTTQATRRHSSWKTAPPTLVTEIFLSIRLHRPTSFRRHDLATLRTLSGDINATMRFNSSIGNGWDDFNWAISNLTMVMGLLNDSMIALHNFTASLRPEILMGLK
ncbi:hypothetical protein BSL78_23363 [Apostichopus japonicus]|uniref:Uncharacterized protein n=1 Tax=Stichopus japonicus TaxID=307972 RepID=A0A2G8JVT1_STIJA|nr:hypothetical protein BSL78_23363 [Apostichopus japonicus]